MSSSFFAKWVHSTLRDVHNSAKQTFDRNAAAARKMLEHTSEKLALICFGKERSNETNSVQDGCALLS